MSRLVTLERLAYAAAAPVLAAAPNTAPNGVTHSVLVLAGVAGAAGTWRAVDRAEGAGRAIVRWSPLSTALAVDVAALLTPGWGWDALIATGWAAIGAVVLPLTRTTRRRRPALAAPPLRPPAPPVGEAPAVDDGADPFTRGIRTLWETAGNPARTHVVGARRHDGTTYDASLLVRASEPGRPITGLTEAGVAAALGVHERDVTLAEVPHQNGRHGGPGWREIHVTPEAGARRRAAPTDTERWVDRIGRAGGGAPGSVLKEIRRDEKRRVTLYRAEMADAVDEPRVDLARLCRGLEIPHDDSRVFLLKEDHRFLVSVFDEPPLSKIFPATRELLTPDERGMFVCGYSYTGQPVRNFVWQADKNAACHGLILGVTRSGKTQYFAIAMAAQSLAGGVVWLASAKRDEKTDTLAEHIDRQGNSVLWMLRMLRAAVALCEIRASMPWEHDGKPHDFKPGDPRCPYKLMSVYADEYVAATRDATYGQEIQALGDALVLTGLKYGVGLYVAGQNPWVDGGFSTELKDNMRMNSRPLIFNMGSNGATRKAIGDAMTDAHDAPTIPARYAVTEGSVLDRAMTGEADPENGVGTGGVAIVVLDGGRATLVRTLLADFNTPGAVAEIFPDAVNHLTAHEITSLEQLDLWGDWYRPEPVETDDEDEHGPRPRGKKKQPTPAAAAHVPPPTPPAPPARSSRDVLAAIREHTTV
ncbi:chromosome segregation protein ParM [Streptomyces sp. SID3343]|uniref:chromosome segregation protein ParM n=1 Tax=Streptomyces sp. SID3343 TaxID=2690260 RepID=UPI00136E7041|nr:chromosome segregation protein ParM [Streptomyces sp. SID3343]MYW06036.1 chromosome segregation protein ParM [Streptomyces sp. SID3343]